jgi:hypothetical protein
LVKTIATIAFAFGALVGLVSGFRLFVRAYKEMQVRGRAYESDLINNIELKDTVGLELLGLLGGIALVQIAIRFI